MHNRNTFGNNKKWYIYFLKISTMFTYCFINQWRGFLKKRSQPPFKKAQTKGPSQVLLWFLDEGGHILFTVPYFFVRLFRYTASYRQGYLDFQMYRGGGHFSRLLSNRPHPLSSFDTHARWQPVTQSARYRWSYGKIEDCEQSREDTDRSLWNDVLVC